MAKLEELSELLVSEIKDFEEAVKRLEAIHKKKIQLDISDLQMSLGKHEKFLVTTESETEKRLKRIEVIFQKAKNFQKWAVISLVVSLILNFITLMVFFYIGTLNIKI